MSELALDVSGTGLETTTTAGFQYQGVAALLLAGGLLHGPVTSVGALPVHYESLSLTSVGVAVDNTRATASVLLELRRLSGLTWEELASLFGVARRSLLLWASGRALSSGNEQKLYRLVALFRQIDRGTAQQNRELMMQPVGANAIRFDLLVAGRFDDVLECVGARPGRRKPTPGPLSAEARRSREPLDPSNLVGALQDRVHRGIGRSKRGTPLPRRGG